MKLLYNRVQIEKIIDEEWAPGIIKHYYSDDKRMVRLSKGVVINVGLACKEVKEGDIVAYPTHMERFLQIGNQKLVELREDSLQFILIEPKKVQLF